MLSTWWSSLAGRPGLDGAGDVFVAAAPDPDLSGNRERRLGGCARAGALVIHHIERDLTLDMAHTLIREIETYLALVAKFQRLYPDPPE